MEKAVLEGDPREVIDIEKAVRVATSSFTGTVKSTAATKKATCSPHARLANSAALFFILHFVISAGGPLGADLRGRPRSRSPIPNMKLYDTADQGALRSKRK
jgi:hypothetical protein